MKLICEYAAIRIEIFIPDVASPENGHLVVNGKGLVVHAAGYRANTRDKLKDSTRIAAERVEYPDLYVGVSV